MFSEAVALEPYKGKQLQRYSKHEVINIMTSLSESGVWSPTKVSTTIAGCGRKSEASNVWPQLVTEYTVNLSSLASPPESASSSIVAQFSAMLTNM